MSATAETILRPKLDADERLIWCGQPRQGLRLQPADVFLIPFGLFWTAFSVFGVVSIIIQETDPDYPKAGLGAAIFGLIVVGAFVLFGLYVLAGRFWVDAAMRQRTHYGVTDQRIIIVSGLFRRSVKSVSLRTLSDVTMTESSSGIGSITFGPVPPWYYYWYGSGWPGMAGTFGMSCFQPIDQVGEVYNIILQAQRAA